MCGVNELWRVRMQSALIDHQFRVGQRVRVPKKEVEWFHKLHEESPMLKYTWKQAMDKYIGRVGFVSRVTEEGLIRVTFFEPTNENSPAHGGYVHYHSPANYANDHLGLRVKGVKWKFHPAALEACELYPFVKGEVVLSPRDMLYHLASPFSPPSVERRRLQYAGMPGLVKDILDNGEIVVVKLNTDGTIRIPPKFLLPVYTPNRLSMLDAPPAIAQNTAKRGLKPVRLTTRFGSALPLERRKEFIQAVTKSRQNYDAIADFIFRYREHIDVSTEDGRTALMLAVENGDMKAIELLLRNGAYIGRKCNRGNTPLHYAIMSLSEPACLTVMNRILLHGIDGGMSTSLINVPNDEGLSPFHLAANYKYYSLIAFMLKCPGFDPNLKNGTGETVLDQWLAGGDESGVMMLIHSGLINPFRINSQGFNAFHWAALHGSAMVCQMLLSEWPELLDYPVSDGSTALHLAAIGGHCEVVHLLLLSQARCDKLTNKMLNPLCATIQPWLHNDIPLPSCINTQQGSRLLILDMIVKMSQANGGSIWVGNSEGNTAVHLAMMALKYRATPPPNVIFALQNIESCEIERLAEICEDWEELAAVCYLLAQRDSPIDRKNNKEMTPLLLAPPVIPQHLWQHFISLAPRPLLDSSTASNSRANGVIVDCLPLSLPPPKITSPDHLQNMMNDPVYKQMISTMGNVTLGEGEGDW